MVVKRDSVLKVNELFIWTDRTRSEPLWRTSGSFCLTLQQQQQQRQRLQQQVFYILSVRHRAPSQLFAVQCSREPERENNYKKPEVRAEVKQQKQQHKHRTKEKGEVSFLRLWKPLVVRKHKTFCYISTNFFTLWGPSYKHIEKKHFNKRYYCIRCIRMGIAIL